MSDISQFRIEGTTYSIKDADARAAVASVASVTATSAAPGVMSAADKIKLDGIAENANAYEHPSYTSVVTGLYKFGVDGTGHVASTTSVSLTDLTSIGVASSATVTSGVGGQAGLMSAADKAVLDGLKTSYDNLVEDAPGAYDTLKEIGSYISTHTSEYEALAALASTQADWNQSNTSAADYINNKPESLKNPNSLKVQVGGADKQTYDGSSAVTLNLYAGSNVSIAENNGTYTFSATDTTYGAATTASAGLMSANDKVKLNNIANNANAYTHPSHTSASSGLYKITIDSYGHVINTTAVTSADIAALGFNPTPANATSATYGIVKISDNYSSSAGNASSAVAASSQAVYNVYNLLANGGTAVTSTMTSTDNSKKIATTAFVNNFWNGKYTYSTTDLEAGVSALPTGNLYFVYEN